MVETVQLNPITDLMEQLILAVVVVELILQAARELQVAAGVQE